MMFMTIDVFIVEMPVCEIDLFYQSTVDQEGDGPIQGCLGDPLLLVPQSQKEFIHIEVIVERKDLLDDRLPFRRVAQPPFPNVSPKLLYGIHDRTIFIENQFQYNLRGGICQGFFAVGVR